MRNHEGEITTAANLVAIGTGDLEYARDFRDSAGISFPLLVDPRMASYRAVGTKKGQLTDSLKPSILAAGARAVRAGARQGKTGPKPLVLGATHVIRPDGTVAYAWINDDFSDSAPVEDVLAALA